MHAEDPIWVQLGQQNGGAFLKETHCLNTTADYTVSCLPGGFSGFATLRFRVRALPKILLLERKMRRLARGEFFFFYIKGVNYKTTIRGRSKDIFAANDQSCLQSSPALNKWQTPCLPINV